MKAVVVIVLVIGLIGGLAVGYNIAPQGVGTDTTALEQRISQLEGQVSTLQSQMQEKDSQISNLTSQKPEPRSMTSILLENRTVESIEDRFYMFCNVSEFSQIKLAWDTTSDATNNAFVFRYRWVVFPEEQLNLGEVLYVPPETPPPKYYTMTPKTDIYPIAGFGNAELEVKGSIFFLWVYEYSTAFQENTIEYITLFATS